MAPLPAHPGGVPGPYPHLHTGPQASPPPHLSPFPQHEEAAGRNHSLAQRVQDLEHRYSEASTLQHIQATLLYDMQAQINNISVLTDWAWRNPTCLGPAEMRLQEEMHHPGDEELLGLGGRGCFTLRTSLKGSCRERHWENCFKSPLHWPGDGAKLFPVVPSDRTRGNGLKLKPGKFHLNPRKNFFPLRVTEHWPRLPREVVESPSLEIFKTCLDKVLYSLL